MALLPNRALLVLITIISLGLLEATAQRPCYDIRGKIAPGRRPCSSEGASLCCGDNSYCLSNNLCFYASANTLSRGVSVVPVGINKLGS